LKAWEYYILEQQLDKVEVTHFTINKNRGYYICLGSWNIISHPQQTPAEFGQQHHPTLFAFLGSAHHPLGDLI
jgi:hypothetical protein